MTKSESLLQRRMAVVSNGVGIFNNATAAYAKGAKIVDLDGNEFLDFAGGIGVVNAGHCPQPVVDAIIEQTKKFIHTSFNVVTYEPYIELCEKLVEILPHGESTKVMLVSTGAEAVENAVKIAKQHTSRQAVLCFTGAFHGRTLMAMTLTSKISYKQNCGPFAPEVYRLPFPNKYRYGQNLTEDEFVDQELRRLHESALNLVNPESVAAIIIEPIQGEGGFYPAPKKYLVGLKEFCDTHGIVLIFDEVQSGFARTGKWAAYEHYGITPDLSTWAKSMGSGLPIGCVIGKAEIMDSAKPGTIGGTYIGNPVACAGALATIKYMEEIDLNQRGVEVGNIIRTRFEEMKSKFPQIGDVRGLGAMMAMEFNLDGDPKKPDHELCKKVINFCFSKKLIIISAGTHKNIIRILCPLVITNDELNQGLDIIEAAIAEAVEN